MPNLTEKAKLCDVNTVMLCTNTFKNSFVENKSNCEVCYWAAWYLWESVLWIHVSKLECFNLEIYIQYIKDLWKQHC